MGIMLFCKILSSLLLEQVSNLEGTQKNKKLTLCILQQGGVDVYRHSVAVSTEREGKDICRT